MLWVHIVDYSVYVGCGYMLWAMDYMLWVHIVDYSVYVVGICCGLPRICCGYILYIVGISFGQLGIYCGYSPIYVYSNIKKKINRLNTSMCR